MIACSRSTVRYTSLVQRVHQVHEVAFVKIGTGWLVFLECWGFRRIFGDVAQGELRLLYCIGQGFSLCSWWVLLTSTFFLHWSLARVLALVQDSLGSEKSTCAEVVGLEQMVEFIIIDVLIGQLMMWMGRIGLECKLFRMRLQVLLGEMSLWVQVLRLEIWYLFLLEVQPLLG